MNKLTMLINNNGGIACGWSETMWTDATGDSTLRTLAQAWCFARAKILSAAFQIIAVRISSDPASPPVVTSIYRPTSPIAGQLGSGPDYPNTSVLISFQSGGASEHRDLRGWPDSYIEAPGVDRTVQLSNEGRRILGFYFSDIAGLVLGWRRLKRNGDAGFLAVPIDAVTTDATTNTAVFTGVFPGSMTGTNKGAVRVLGFKGERAFLNGTLNTDSYGITSTTLLTGKPATTSQIATYIKQSAQVVQQAYTFSRATSGLYERISAHKTGRPFAQLRGRR